MSADQDGTARGITRMEAFSDAVSAIGITLPIVAALVRLVSVLPPHAPVFAGSPRE